MRAAWETWLQRWLNAGLLDEATAERIRAFEASGTEEQKLRWPVLVTVSLGGLMLGAGVLLFVAAHWDELSPATRFTLLLLLVAIFHLAGVLLADRFAVLTTVLHALGTASLGAGIFLAGQIFHLQEHWPGGLMLWAAGAWAGWFLRRDWTQATFVALLMPAWLMGEWLMATTGLRGRLLIPQEGLLLLALTYLSARSAEKGGPVRRALVTLGGLATIPLTFFVLLSGWDWRGPAQPVPSSLRLVGWLVALGGPLLLAWWLRGRNAWMSLPAALWVAILGTLAQRRDRTTESLLVWAWHELGPYIWCGIGSVGLVAWGVYEARKERINLGFAGFALTVLVFYFSSVMDKLGRSESLIGGGVLFLVGGWILERTRRRVVARLGGAA